jgi:hypothetical protein
MILTTHTILRSFRSDVSVNSNSDVRTASLLTLFIAGKEKNIDVMRRIFRPIGSSSPHHMTACFLFSEPRILFALGARTETRRGSAQVWTDFMHWLCSFWTQCFFSALYKMCPKLIPFEVTVKSRNINRFEKLLVVTSRDVAATLIVF